MPTPLLLKNLATLAVAGAGAVMTVLVVEEVVFDLDETPTRRDDGASIVFVPTPEPAAAPAETSAPAETPAPAEAPAPTEAPAPLAGGPEEGARAAIETMPDPLDRAAEQPTPSAERPDDDPDAPVELAEAPSRANTNGPLYGPRPAPDPSGAVVIQSITYDEEGDVTISGSGEPGAVAQLFLDETLEAEAEVGPEGDWSIALADDVAPAVYTLRVDQMTADGVVTSRAETPFERAPTNLLLRDGAVVVQPGNNLWKISEYVYGAGVEYPTIFRSNRDQIHDPDLIFPGQVLFLPGSDPTVLLTPPTR